jgi:hypothetical protein
MDQSSATASIPVLILEQGDISEEEFIIPKDTHERNMGVIDADISLEINTPGFDITSSGIQFSSAIDYNDWFDCGLLIRAVEQRTAVIQMWLWGDWAVFGEVKYEEEYSQTSGRRHCW